MNFEETAHRMSISRAMQEQSWLMQELESHAPKAHYFAHMANWDSFKIECEKDEIQLVRMTQNPNYLGLMIKEKIVAETDFGPLIK